MPTARGFVKSHGNALVATFDIDDNLRYFSIDVKSRNQSFECTNATLAYSSSEGLIGNCKWRGTIGKEDFRMDLGGGVSIAGSLDTARSSSVILRGAGTWRLDAAGSPNQLSSADRQQENGEDAPDNSVSPKNAFDRPDAHMKLERERKLLTSGAPIIAIFGQSGTGKSAFINLITLDQQKVGKGLQSCTSEINIIEAEIGGKRVVIIDTPGIDDTRDGMKESDVLISIAGRLGYMGQHRVWVTGVLFLHRISDNKFNQTANRISNMLKHLCGDDAMNHLTLCTTMWDKVDEDEGYERLEELCETGAWMEMISSGAGTARISNINPNAKDDAEKIVNELIRNSRPVKLAIQDEMVNQGKTVAQTGAGQVLSKHLREARAEAERTIREMRESMRQENEVNAAKAQESIRVLTRAVEELKRQADAMAHAHFDAQLQLQREKAEREMKDLRENFQKESARTQEAMLKQQLEVEEMKMQFRAQQERLRQEQEDERRKMEQNRESLRKENEAKAAKIQEAMRTEQLKAERLKEQAEEEARLWQEETERLRWERDMKELHKESGETPTPTSFGAPDDPVTLARESWLLRSNPPIIAIFGQSGAGKSTFINLIASEKVGRSFRSCASDIRIIEAKVGGERVAIIDSPGIEDTHSGMMEADTLLGIIRRLRVLGKDRGCVTGVLFLHRITGNKFSPTARRVSKMMRNLCGDVAMSRLMLCATMRDKVTEGEGDDRLEELCKTGAWKEMISNGASSAMISNIGTNAKAKAENIMSELIKNARTAMLLIRDEVNLQQVTKFTIPDQKKLREAREQQAREQEAREQQAREQEARERAAREQGAREQERVHRREMEELREQQRRLEEQARAQQGCVNQ